MKQTVYFILDMEFKDSLYKLSRNNHVWICKSKNNDKKVNEVWEKDNFIYKQNKGVTSFEISQSIISTFYSFLLTINEHHQGNNNDIEEWNKIIVYGIEYDKINKNEIVKDLQTNVKIEKKNDYFIIIKI